MPLTTPKAMFERAYKEGYAIGAFNVNNMEIIQGIMQAGSEEQAPLILQVSAGARKYAGQPYIMKLVEGSWKTTFPWWFIWITARISTSARPALTAASLP